MSRQDEQVTRATPEIPLRHAAVTFFGELVFMLWLLIRGWKIEDPSAGEPARPVVEAG